MKRFKQALNIAWTLAAVIVLGGWWLSQGPRHSIEAQWRSGCKNNLKVIGLALHNYRDTYGSFPPAYIADANGVPMHSWRVLLLPFLDQQAAYDEYDFDEPWDSPANRKITSIPFGAYRCPSDQSKNRSRTNYVAVIGSHTAWPAPQVFSGTPDNSEVIAVIETVDTGIEWAEPRDFSSPQMAPHINSHSCCGPASRHKGGVNVLRLDGSVHFLDAKISADELYRRLMVEQK